jgi:hypothetical protein
MAARRETQPAEPEVIPPQHQHHQEPVDEEEDREVDDSQALVKLNKGELEMQMEFARKYPRQMSKVMKMLRERTCYSPAIALEMTYSLPRGGKQITGASSRFAEILAASWGNNMSLCRVVGSDAEFVRAQGIYFDCESNYRHGREVARRITDSRGNRFNADMIAVTGGAAASIAFRNAVLNGVGKGVWFDVYLQSQQVATGDAQSVVRERDELLTWAKQAGVTGEMLFNTLQVQGVQDIVGEKFLALKIIRKEIAAGERTVDEVFGTLETANVEAAMTQLGWNEGQKTVSRQAYRGRAAEHLAYLREQIDTLQRRGVSTAAPAKKEAAPAAKKTEPVMADPETKKPEPEAKPAEKEAAKEAAPAKKGSGYDF